MAILLKFLFGAAIGSFLNVLAVRYDPDKFLLTEKTLGGRSKCPQCKRTLRWFELIPILSFVAQGGACRRCKKSISPQYLMVEILCGLIFLFVPSIADVQFPLHASFIPSIIWTTAFLILLLISLIDLRLYMIPDELTLALAALGVALGFLSPETISSRVMSALGAGAFFLFIFEVYQRVRRTEGMGFGDVKLAIALGLLLGFPDILIALGTSFITGAIIGVVLIVFGKSGLKTAVPFGPFLAFGSFVAFACGGSFFAWYIALLVGV